MHSALVVLLSPTQLNECCINVHIGEKVSCTKQLTQNDDSTIILLYIFIYDIDITIFYYIAIRYMKQNFIRNVNARYVGPK